MTVLLSIVVCTLNRDQILKNALTDLSFPLFGHPDLWEVITIDNASTDMTKEVADSFIKQFPNFKYFYESKVGLSHARNRGWQEAKGEYIAYVDDDCRIPPDWILQAQKIIEEISPLAFGGPYLPFYVTLKPGWYKDSYASYQRGRYPDHAVPAEYFNLCGGNMVIQRKILAALDGFNPRLGMAGIAMGYAEEDDLQMRIRQRWPGGLIYFDPQFFVYHLVNAIKMRISWRIRQRYHLGKSRVILRYESVKNMTLIESILRGFKIIISLCISFLKGIFFRDRVKYPSFYNWIYEVSSLYFTSLGEITERWNQQMKTNKIS